MRSALRAPFLVTVASASLAACGSAGAGSNESVVEPARNPPPIPALTACPPAAPQDGTACAGDLYCHYGSTDGCDPTYVDYNCVSGAFRLAARPTCNPPPPPPPPGGMETSKP